MRVAFVLALLRSLRGLLAFRTLVLVCCRRWCALFALDRSWRRLRWGALDSRGRLLRTRLDGGGPRLLALRPLCLLVALDRSLRRRRIRVRSHGSRHL